VSSARALGWTVVSLAALAAGCAAALGLDAPTLDPCAGGGCEDVTSDVAPGEAASTQDAPPDVPSGDAAGDAHAEGSTDAAKEATGDGAPPDGVRCGGGIYGTPSYCAPGSATPTCCQTTTDAGVTTYGCVASEAACTGYAITCATYNDCSGSEICCHFSTHMICDAVSSCPNQDVVCDPTMSDSCPTGEKCTVYFSNAGVEAPYQGCQ